MYMLVVERPQHMLMRVAVGIHKDDIDAAVEVDIYNPKILMHEVLLISRRTT